MTSQFRLSPTADQDLDDQAGYLAREAGLDTALRFYDAAAVTFAKIARMPGIGELRPTNHPRLAGLRAARVEGFEKHLVFYRSDGEDIVIVRVLHGARDLDRILAEESGVDEDVGGTDD